MKLIPAGVSKAGKPYNAFETCNTCKPYRKPAPQAPQAPRNDNDVITRSAIAKSMIESGKINFDQALPEANKWFNWCKQGHQFGTTPPVAQPSTVSEVVQEAKDNAPEISDIPF